MKMLKSFVIMTALLASMTATFAVSPTDVTIKHKTGNGTFVIITVSIFALPAHLAHGDILVDDGGGDECLDC